jgi:hypothetical protein
VDCTYGFLTWVNHAGIYVELLDAGNLHFTIEECLAEACANKQIFGELARLLCSEQSIPPILLAVCVLNLVRRSGCETGVSRVFFCPKKS